MLLYLERESRSQGASITDKSTNLVFSLNAVSVTQHLFDEVFPVSQLTINHNNLQPQLIDEANSTPVF